MVYKILLSFLLLFATQNVLAASNTSTADCEKSDAEILCRANPDEICASMPPINLGLEQQISDQANSQFFQDRPKPDPAKLEESVQEDEAYVLIAPSFYEHQAIMKHFSQIGFSEADLQKRLNSIQARVVTAIQNSRKFGTLSTSAIQSVKKTKIMTASILNDPSVTPKQVAGFLHTCGEKGLAKNAYYDKDTSALYVCPGTLLFFLEQGNVDGLDFLIAHELGHSFGPHNLKGQTIQDLPSAQKSPWGSYLKCLEDNHYSDFRDISLSSENSHYLATLNQCIDSLSRSKKQDAALLNYLANLRAQEMLTQAMIPPELADGSEKYKSKFSPSTSHLEEVTSDLVAQKSIEQYLSTLPTQKRVSYLKSQMRFFCKPPLESYFKPEITKCFGSSTEGQNDLKLFNLEGDEGSHPSNEYRFHAFFSNPNIRGALGCSKMGSVVSLNTRTYCDYSGQFKGTK